MFFSHTLLCILVVFFAHIIAFNYLNPIMYTPVSKLHVFCLYFRSLEIKYQIYFSRALLYSWSANKFDAAQNSGLSDTFWLM